MIVRTVSFLKMILFPKMVELVGMENTKVLSGIVIPDNVRTK